MSGIRERKKLQTQEKILEISKSLFEKKGYNNVKTSEIAVLCDIGEGTLFNYYKSKSDLFISAFFQNFDNLNYEINIKTITSKEKIIEEIINIINYYLSNLSKMNKMLIREYYSIIYDFKNYESKIVRESQDNAEKIIINSLYSLFMKLIENKIINKNFDFKTAIKCIHSCSMNTFNEFVFDENISFDSMMTEVKIQILFILKKHLIQDKK